MRFEVARVLVHLMSADMKTSHGEPAAICVSSVLDEAELINILQLYCCSNALVMLATTFVRLEAMKTVSVAGVGVAVGTGVGVGEVVTAGDGVGEVELVGVGVGLFVGLGVGVGVADGCGVGELDGLEFAFNVPAR
jgi:hypothetical protein